jgi:hypothetical protein
VDHFTLGVLFVAERDDRGFATARVGTEFRVDVSLDRRGDRLGLRSNEVYILQSVSSSRDRARPSVVVRRRARRSKKSVPPPIHVFTVHDSCRPPSAAIRAKPYLARGVPPDRPRRARVARDRRLDPRRRATRATHFQHPPRAVPRPSARHRPREGAARDRPPRSIARSFVRSFDARASRPSRASSSRASSRVARRLKNTHLDLGRLEGGDAADEGGSEKGRHYD